MPLDRYRFVANNKGRASRFYLEGHEWDLRDVKFRSLI